MKANRIITLAAIVAQPLGHRVQERITTTPEVDGLQIGTVSLQERGKLVIHKVVIERE
jgi:hypothetical protein